MFLNVFNIRSHCNIMCLAHNVEHPFSDPVNINFQFCKALHFEIKKPANCKFNFCFHKGRVKLMPIKRFHAPLQSKMSNPQKKSAFIKAQFLYQNHLKICQSISGKDILNLVIQTRENITKCVNRPCKKQIKIEKIC